MPEKSARDGGTKSKFPSLVIHPYGRERAAKLCTDCPKTRKLIYDCGSTPDQIHDSARREYRERYRLASDTDVDLFVTQILRTLQLNHPADLDCPGAQSTRRKALA